MWSFFGVYLLLGFEHITDSEGYDHMLFLLVLAAPYLWFRKKTMLWLISAFTLGHCLTLALAVFDLFRLDPDLVETLIPITILITAILNLVHSKWKWVSHPTVTFAMATLFGLIHGLGFSTFFRDMITDQFDLVHALLAFNIGLELGQILILGIIIGLSWLVHKFFKVKAQHLTVIFSALAALLSIHLLIG